MSANQSILLNNLFPLCLLSIILSAVGCMIFRHPEWIVLCVLGAFVGFGALYLSLIGFSFVEPSGGRPRELAITRLGHLWVDEIENIAKEREELKRIERREQEEEEMKIKEKYSKTNEIVECVLLLVFGILVTTGFLFFCFYIMAKFFKFLWEL